MKKTSLILGALLLAAGLTGCGDKKEAAPAEKAAEAPKAEKKLNIGFTAYKYDDNFIALFRKVVSEEAGKVADKDALQMHDTQTVQTTQNDQNNVILSKSIHA